MTSLVVVLHLGIFLGKVGAQSVSPLHSSSMYLDIIRSSPHKTQIVCIVR